MPVEREALVVRVGPGEAWVSPLSTCSACGGCGGRCDWLAEGSRSTGLRLPQALFAEPPVAGQRVRLSWEAPALLAVALRAYGLPLAGLLLGAGGAELLNDSFHFADLAVLAGALAGTLLGMALSKRALSSAHQLRVLPASCDTASDAAPRAH